MMFCGFKSRCTTPSVVRRFQGHANLLHHANGLFGGKFSLLGDDIFEVLAFDKLHGDELDAVGLPEIENANHVFVGYLPRENQLLLEAVKNFRIDGKFRANDFQRDEAVHFAVARFIHSAHAALAEELQDFVARSEDRPGCKRGSGGGEGPPVVGVAAALDQDCHYLRWEAGVNAAVPSAKVAPSKFKRGAALGAASRCRRIDGMALGALHYFRRKVGD